MNKPLMKLLSSFFEERSNHFSTPKTAHEIASLMMEEHIFLHDILMDIPHDENSIKKIQATLTGISNFPQGAQLFGRPDEHILDKVDPILESHSYPEKEKHPIISGPCLLEIKDPETLRRSLKYLHDWQNDTGKKFPPLSLEWEQDLHNYITGKHFYSGVKPQVIASWMEANGLTLDSIILGKSIVEIVGRADNIPDYSLFGLTPDIQTQEKYAHLPCIRAWCTHHMEESNLTPALRAHKVALSFDEEIRTNKARFRKFLRENYHREAWNQQLPRVNLCAVPIKNDQGEALSLSLSQAIAGLSGFEAKQMDSGIGLLLNHVNKPIAKDLTGIKCMSEAGVLDTGTAEYFLEFITSKMFEMRNHDSLTSVLAKESDFIAQDVIPKIKDKSKILLFLMALNIGDFGSHLHYSGIGKINKAVWETCDKKSIASLFKTLKEEKKVFSRYSPGGFEPFDTESYRNNTISFFYNNRQPNNDGMSISCMATECYANGLIDSGELLWFHDTSAERNFCFDFNRAKDRILKETPETITELAHLAKRDPKEAEELARQTIDVQNLMETVSATPKRKTLSI